MKTAISVKKSGERSSVHLWKNDENFHKEPQQDAASLLAICRLKKIGNSPTCITKIATAGAQRKKNRLLKADQKKDIALKLITKQMTIQQAMETYDLSKRTLFNWKKIYEVEINPDVKKTQTHLNKFTLTTEKTPCPGEIHEKLQTNNILSKLLERSRPEDAATQLKNNDIISNNGVHRLNHNTSGQCTENKNKFSGPYTKHPDSGRQNEHNAHQFHLPRACYPNLLDRLEALAGENTLLRILLALQHDLIALSKCGNGTPL